MRNWVIYMLKLTFVSTFGVLGGFICCAGDFVVTERPDFIRVNNGKIVLRINKRKNAEAVLMYTDESLHIRAAGIIPVTAGRKLTVMKSCSVRKTNKDGIEVKVFYALPNGGMTPVVYMVAYDSEYVGVALEKPIDGIFVDMCSEALIVPDQIGEDIVSYPPAAACKYILPADARYSLNLLDNGNAILTTIWSSDQTVITEGRLTDAKTVPSGFDFMNFVIPVNGKLWIGVLANPGIWHKVTKKLNNMNYTAINWSPPFKGRWFVAMKKAKGFIQQEDGQGDIWNLPERKKKPRLRPGVVMMNADLWHAGSSGFGRFIYPGYIKDDRTFLRFPKILFSSVAYDSMFPPLIYPLENSEKSIMILPANAVRKFLGSKVYNQLYCALSRNKYPATCLITKKVEKIFYRDEAQKERENIKKMLKRMDLFVLSIRERINEYLVWHEQMKKYFNEQRKQVPTLTAVIDEFDCDLSGIAWLYAKGKNLMKTPEYCTTLSQKIIQLIDSDLDDEQQEEECKKLGRAIRTIGGKQDMTLGKMRMLVKAVRQKATLRLMKSCNPLEVKFLREIRTKTAAIMDNRLGPEGK